MSTPSVSENSSRQPICFRQLDVWLGVVGMLITIYGAVLPPGTTAQSLNFLIGAILLLASAVINKHRYFIALESIVLIGCLMAFTPTSNLVKATVPILFSFFILVYFIRQGDLRDGPKLLGALGIALLAIGYAITHPLIYCIGSLVLAIYAWFSWREGQKIALLWIILNLAFAGVAAYNLRHFLG